MENEMEDKSSINTNTGMFTGMTKWHVIVVIGTAIGTIIEGLIPHSFGTFIANFKSGLNGTVSVVQADRSFTKATQFELNWLPALSSALPCILLPLFSFVIKKINRFYQIVSITSFLLVGLSCILSSVVVKWESLFLSYSLVYSVGTSIFLAVVVAIVADYFPVQHRCHVMATSLYQIGYPTSALIGNPILAYLIVQYGWRKTFKFVSVIQVTTGIVIGCIMKPLGQGLCCSRDSSEKIPVCVPDENVGENSEVNKDREESTSSVRKLMINFQLWPWLIGKYINYLCWYGLRTNIVTYLVNSTNYGLEWSASLMSVYASAEIVVALFASLFGDKLRGWLVHVHIVAAASMAILTGIYAVTMASYLSAALLMICIGIAVQFSLSFGYPASVEVLNSEFDMKTGWIITNVAAGLGILSSPILSGLLMDKFNLVALFYAQCTGWTFQAIFYAITLIIIRAKQNKVQDDYHELKYSK